MLDGETSNRQNIGISKILYQWIISLFKKVRVRIHFCNLNIKITAFVLNTKECRTSNIL